MLAIGWLLIATISQLTVSIREIFNLVSADNARIYKLVIYYSTSIIGVLQILIILVLPNLTDTKKA